MTRDPLSNALRTAAAKYEAFYSKAGTHANPELAIRARRRRLGAIAAVSTLSLALIAVSGAAAAYILRGDPATTTNPIAPPVPEGYERVVVPLFDEEGRLWDISSPDPVFEAIIGEGACGSPLPDLGDAGPFEFKIDSVSLPLPEGMSPSQYLGQYGSLPMEYMVSATLSYDGQASGAVDADTFMWVLLDDDGAFVSGLWGGIFDSESFTRGDRSLADPFSMSFPGWVIPEDCAKTVSNLDAYPPTDYREVMLDPGSYSIVAIAKVEWSPVGSVLSGAERLGLNPAWFGKGWREAAPCQDGIDEARRTQDGGVLECLPHLYYRQVFSYQGLGVGAYAIVDVPDGFLSGPRKTWYVVSEPYPVEWSVEGLTPFE